MCDFKRNNADRMMVSIMLRPYIKGIMGERVVFSRLHITYLLVAHLQRQK